MDEDEYKETYLSLNTRVCAFEKVILSRQCDCARATRIFIAERQAVGCDSEAAQRQCAALLAALHNNANFALKLTSTRGRLPHAKEMKVQCGGLLGLQTVVQPERATQAEVPDINGLVDAACTRFGALDELPYSEIVKAIAAYQGRRSGGHRGR